MNLLNHYFLNEIPLYSYLELLHAQCIVDDLLQLRVARTFYKLFDAGTEVGFLNGVQSQPLIQFLFQ